MNVGKLCKLFTEIGQAIDKVHNFPASPELHTYAAGIFLLRQVMGCRSRRRLKNILSAGQTRLWLKGGIDKERILALIFKTCNYPSFLKQPYRLDLRPCSISFDFDV
jgi:hypothetical protein